MITLRLVLVRFFLFTFFFMALLTPIRAADTAATATSGKIGAEMMDPFQTEDSFDDLLSEPTVLDPSLGRVQAKTGKAELAADKVSWQRTKFCERPHSYDGTG